MTEPPMTDILKASIIRSLVRAGDAIQDGFKQAAAAGHLDLAKELRESNKRVAACIRTLSGPIPTTLEELVRGRTLREDRA